MPALEAEKSDLESEEEAEEEEELDPFMAKIREATYLFD